MPRQRSVADTDLCCSPLGAATLDDDDATTLAHAFAALSDPVRLKLLSYIASAGPAQVCACDLTAPAGRSQPTVSHHMKVLFEAGLVNREKRGLWVWYSVVPEQLARLRQVLA